MTTASWQRALRRSGIVLVGLLAIAAGALRDVEATAFALGGLVALGSTFWRKGLLGTLGLGVLGADVALWMGPAAYSNITHGEGGWETLLPSLLTVTATTTFASSVGDIVRRRRSTEPRGHHLVQAVGLVLVIASVIVTRIATGDETTPRPGDLQVETEDVRFSDETLEAPAGDIGILVSNKDLFWHTFTIAELNVNVNVPVGAERHVSFVAQPGTYRFVCAIPGHTQAGMEGVLRVL